jgi:hypothetical protein
MLDGAQGNLNERLKMGTGYSNPLHPILSLKCRQNKCGNKPLAHSAWIWGTVQGLVDKLSLSKISNGNFYPLHE